MIWSKFHHISTKWIFLECTWRGLLKNVPDGISRRIGSREFQKTKVYTVLLGTLYIDNFELPWWVLDGGCSGVELMLG